MSAMTSPRNTSIDCMRSRPRRGSEPPARSGSVDCELPSFETVRSASATNVTRYVLKLTRQLIADVRGDVRHVLLGDQVGIELGHRSLGVLDVSDRRGLIA